MSQVTAILLSYQRQPNMPLIIETLRAQTVPIEIWLINNNGMESFGADRLIAIPWNSGEWARYVFASRIETPYGMFLDDDFVPGDPLFVERAIELQELHAPDHIIGVAGRGLQSTPPHYAPDIVNRDGYAAILKGHFQLWPRGITRRYRLSSHPSASDIYWALDTGGGEARHFVSAELSGRLETLDRHGVGYELRPEHYAEREEVCAAWLEEKEALYA